MAPKREADGFIKADPDAKRVKREGGGASISLDSIPWAPAVSASSPAVMPKSEAEDRKLKDAVSLPLVTILPLALLPCLSSLRLCLCSPPRPLRLADPEAASRAQSTQATDSLSGHPPGIAFPTYSSPPSCPGIRNSVSADTSYIHSRSPPLVIDLASTTGRDDSSAIPSRPAGVPTGWRRISTRLA